MSIPQTYLLTSPEVSDPFGSYISSHTLINTLKKLNPNVYYWRQFPQYKNYPGKAQGTTCLWFGDPGGSSMKITAFNMGPIPEFTQLNDKGEIMVKGWRAILERCVTMGVASRTAIERAFQVTLTLGGRSPFCTGCMKEAGRMKRVSSASGLCDFHEGPLRSANAIIDKKEEKQYQHRLHGVPYNKTLPQKRDKELLMVHVKRPETKE